MDIYANSKCTSYSCPTLSKTQKSFLTFHKTPTSTHEMPCEHSAKHPRPPTKCLTNTPPGVGDRFIAPVSLHKQIHISALPNICNHIITHTYPHHQTRAFISSNTYIHIIAHAFPFPITWAFTYMRAR